MKTLHTRFSAETTVPYFAGFGLWRQLDGFLSEAYASHRKFVIADENLARLYSQSTDALGETYEWVVFPAGEAEKSRERKAALEDELFKQGAGRDSVLIALGGGVTGDLVGYVAASFQRGLPLIQMPSSLLAQVDSSIGGKVGINHSAGKNLLGAFYHPAAVFADISLLRSLPDEELYNGMGEVIKYAVILDDRLWQILEEESSAILERDPEVLENVITCCAKLKINVVEQDEREGDFRSLLNWGHTVGHAIERLSNYRVKHGFAIAAGMMIAAVLSRDVLGYPEERVIRLKKLLDTYHLSTVDPSAYSFEEIWNAIQTDKKARGGKPRFTLMAAPGQPELFYGIERQELENGLEAVCDLY